MSVHENEVSVGALLDDIRGIAQQQTELTLNIAEGLLASSKSIVSTVRFNSLEEANAFLEIKRDEMMKYANQLHELIASSYLDDLVGQKVMKIQKSLSVSVSSKIGSGSNIKKIEITPDVGVDLSSKIMVTPFHQPHLM